MAESKLGNLFMTFLMIIIGLALTPTVATSTTTAVSALTSSYAAAAALAALITLFWVIIVLAIGVAAVYAQFKGMT